LECWPEPEVADVTPLGLSVNRFAVTIPAKWFNLPLCLESGQVFRWQKLGDGSWLGVDGDNWYRIYPQETIDADNASMKVETNARQEEFESLFRLDWDAKAVETEIMHLAPEMSPYMELFGGLRVMRSSCSTETFFSFLCTPNNNIVRIRQMVRHLAGYGENLAEISGVQLSRFPDLETIASIPERELREKAFGYRAATIPSAAIQILEKSPGWIESLKELRYEEAHRELCSIKGVGPKLADCIALFALDHTEAVPVDTHVWQALTRLYYPEWYGTSVTDSRYREASRAFREKLGALSGWAQQYLFYENMINWRTRKNE